MCSKGEKAPQRLATKRPSASRSRPRELMREINLLPRYPKRGRRLGSRGTLTGDIIIAAQATRTIAHDGIETIRPQSLQHCIIDCARYKDDRRAFLGGTLDHSAYGNSLHSGSSTLMRVTSNVTLRSLVGGRKD